MTRTLQSCGPPDTEWRRWLANRCWWEVVESDQKAFLLSLLPRKEESKPKRLLLDGTQHEAGESCGCMGKPCTKEACPGYMHYQPVYGGYFYECDVCGEIYP